MIFAPFQKALSAAAIIAASCTACAQQADFNEVGKRMAIALQNGHFARPAFGPELSNQFFDDYLKSLDYGRVYFTQSDVDHFRAEYGPRLHTMLLQGKSMTAAEDIYRTFQARVQARVELAEKLLAADEFDFTLDESVQRSRKDAPWPKDEKEAEELWTLQIKEAVLGEVLRRETLSRRAEEQGKPDPSLEDRSPKEKVSLRYKRFLSSVVQDVDDEDIANLFLSAVARSYDPHTDYMSARESDRFRDAMKNELVGIGAMLQAEEDGATKIMGIVVGGPADRAGQLKLNDRVVGVNPLNSDDPSEMVDIMFMKIDKVVELIRGKEGTSVALKVEPAGGPPGETSIVIIERGKVELKDEQASGQVIELTDEQGSARRLGVITLPSFYADFQEGKTRSSVDVERILVRLIDEKIDGLILDLRKNGGGSLEEVRKMTGFFIDRGPVVQVKDSVGTVQVKEAENRKSIYKGPMVVMTDKSSASASEILAGALQDYNRAVVVGESSTFGKGTVQQPMEILKMLPLLSAKDRAGSVKMTIQKFYRPSGSSTQVVGVVPQIVVPSLMDALEVGEAFLDKPLPHDRIRAAAGFKPLDGQALFLLRLKELSDERIAESKDFSYVVEDVVRAKERLAENQISLKKEEREKELAEAEQIQQLRNKERRERFVAITEQDRKLMTFYKLSLDDVENGAELVEFDPAEEDGAYMRRAKNDTEDLDDTPKWPTALDPVKRESLMVLKDLVDLTNNARLAGMLPNAAEIR